MWNFGIGLKKECNKPTRDAIDSSDDDDMASSITSRDEGLECPICWESFNMVENVPYVLWCGHTLCKNCILGLQYAVVRFPNLPIQLPLFISCPWCNHLSLRFSCKGTLKFPRKNYFLLWLLEGMNGDRVKSRPRGVHIRHHLESTGSNDRNNNNNNVGYGQRLRKSLVFFVHLTAKFPLVIIFLFIILYVVPASIVILVIYIVLTFLFALPSFLVLYFSYPSLNWLVREIIN